MQTALNFITAQIAEVMESVMAPWSLIFHWCWNRLASEEHSRLGLYESIQAPHNECAEE